MGKKVSKLLLRKSDSAGYWCLSCGVRVKRVIEVFFGTQSHEWKYYPNRTLTTFLCESCFKRLFHASHYHMKGCLQCGSNKKLKRIKGTNSEYDGLYICEKCLNENESLLDYDDFYLNGLKVR